MTFVGTSLLLVYTVVQSVTRRVELRSQDELLMRMLSGFGLVQACLRTIGTSTSRSKDARRRGTQRVSSLA